MSVFVPSGWVSAVSFSIAIFACVPGTVARGAPQAAALVSPPARFVYLPGPGADPCADEVTLKRAVIARLGRDPFRNDAERTVIVSLRRDGADLSARIELQDAAGKTLGVQEIRSRAANCTELAAALELTLSMVLDARASDVPGPLPPTAIATATPEANPKPSDSGPKLGVGLGVLAAFAAAPTTVAAVSLGIEARWPSYSLGLEGRLDFPSKLAVAEGYVQSSLWMATLVPCLRYHWLAACGLLAAGVQSAEAIGVEGGVAASAAYLAPGARLALAVPLGPVFSAQLRTDLLIPIVRTSIYAGAESVWTTPPASFAAGVTVAAQISR